MFASIAFAALSGLVFGFGLLLSGMADPAKVKGFLDLAAIGNSAWDPSLAFVMAGAIAVAAPAFFVARHRTRSLLGEPMQLPPKARPSPRLVIGSALFGIGWGIAGFCPGPALVALGGGWTAGLVFVAAMLAGMIVFEAIERTRRR